VASGDGGNNEGCIMRLSFYAFYAKGNNKAFIDLTTKFSITRTCDAEGSDNEGCFVFH
jgi:hypothetical protein